MIKKIIFFSVVFLWVIKSYALFCPTNFNQIEIGASIDQVTKLCGAPQTQTTKEIKKEGPQQWTYLIPQTVATPGLQQTEGTLQTQITFDQGGNAVNISVNGIGVGSTTICGTSVSLGDKRDSVKNACGDPAFINRQTNGETDTKDKSKQTEFIYQTTPPYSLIFENGILKNMKRINE